MTRIILASFLAALMLPVPALAQEDEGSSEAEQAHISFADRAIRNWRVPERDILLIEANHGRWYRAEFFGPCPGLRFTQRLGFDTNSDGRFDRFSRVVTPDGVCQLRSLVRIPDPDEPSESDDGAGDEESHEHH